MDTAQKLRFNADGHFRILMVSDFHMGKNPKFAENLNYRVTEGLEALLRETQPDFVLLGGDQCIEAESIPQAAQILSEVIKPVLDRQLPWAAVFGNHDNEVGLPARMEEQAYLTIPGCRNVIHPDASFGAGNYCLPLYSCDGDRLLYNLFALDSHREIADFIDLFDLEKDTRFILPEHFCDGASNAGPTFEQAMWYYETSKRIEAREGRKIPAVMFMHIPLPEFLQVTRNPEECGAVGNKRETLGCCELNFGLFGACLQRGDVKGIFFGHEHLCDIQGEYCGVTMAQDAALGYNMSCHDDLRGGRVIDLCADGTLQTYAVKLIDLMGLDAMRRKDYFEGGCKYFIRKL